MTPYNEQEMQRAGDLIVADYKTAGHPLDAWIIVWGGRIQADAPEMGYERSIAVHEAEWRAGLGLPPKGDPVKPVDPVKPAIHVTPGPPSLPLAQAVVESTAREYPALIQVFDTDEAAMNAMRELLLRVIWHLQLAGVPSARQMNPSGVLSNDKLNVLIPQGLAELSEWVCIDIASIGYAGTATIMRFQVIDGAKPFASAGLADGALLAPSLVAWLPPTDFEA